MGDYGFKYSLSHKSALGNNNPLELGYSSKFRTLKIFKSGKVSVTATALTNTTITVAHGLFYRPAFNAYYTDTLTGEYYPVMSGFEDTSFFRVAAEISVHAKVDNYNLTLVVFNNNAADRNVDLYYDIFVEDLTTEPIKYYG